MTLSIWYYNIKLYRLTVELIEFEDSEVIKHEGANRSVYRPIFPLNFGGPCVLEIILGQQLTI